MAGCTHGATLKGHDGACVLCGARDTIPPPTTIAQLLAAPDPRELLPEQPDTSATDRERADVAKQIGAVVSSESGPTAREQAEALRVELRAKLAQLNEACARGLVYEMLKQSWDTLEPGTPFEDNWHIRDFCWHVQLMLEGQLVALDRATPEMIERADGHWKAHGLARQAGQLLVQNLIANVPPSTLKSRILMVVAPAWMWLHMPTWSHCAISSVDANVDRDSNMCRELITSEWYRSTFSITWAIDKDEDSVSKWKTTAGGIRLSKRMLGGFTGIHVHAILIDDPDDADRVHSEPARKRVHKKYARAIKNRVHSLDTCIRIVIQQRVHVEDLSGFLLSKSRWSPKRRQGWAWFCLPLQHGRGPRDLPITTPFGWRDPRTTPGEKLHPARFSDESIAEEIQEKGTSGFEAQYNQNPAPDDGGMFSRKWMHFFRVDDGVRGEGNVSSGMLHRPDGTPQDEAPFVVARKAGGRFDLDWLSITVDATFGSMTETASAVGLLVVGGKGQRRFIFDDRTMPMTLDQTKAAIRAMILAWPVRRCFVEIKANGKSVVDDMRLELAEGQLVEGFSKRQPLLGPDGKPAQVVLEPINPGSDSKISRARTMVGAYEAGLVYLLEGAAWLDEHVQEVCTFPNAKRDDRVDAISQLMTWYRTQGEATAKARAMNTL